MHYIFCTFAFGLLAAAASLQHRRSGARPIDLPMLYSTSSGFRLGLSLLDLVGNLAALSLIIWALTKIHWWAVPILLIVAAILIAPGLIAIPAYFLLDLIYPLALIVLALYTWFLFSISHVVPFAILILILLSFNGFVAFPQIDNTILSASLISLFCIGAGFLRDGFTFPHIIDGLIQLTLTAGMYFKKSRMCAILLFTSYVVRVPGLIVSTLNTPLVILPLAVTYYLFRGVRATFVYYSRLKAFTSQEFTT